MYMYIYLKYVYIYICIYAYSWKCSAMFDMSLGCFSAIFFQFSHISHASDPNHHQIQSLFALGQPTGWLANHHRIIVNLFFVGMSS